MEQGTKVWKEMRKEHLGCSDLPVLMGKSPFKTAYQLWMEKTGQAEEKEPNPAMVRGSLLEEEARQSYMKETKTLVLPSVLVSQEWPVLMASLDGITEDRKQILEVKCPGEKTYRELEFTGQIPEYWQIQIEGQLRVSQAYFCDLYVYLNEKEHLLYHIYPDPKRSDQIVDAAKEFWKCVESKTAPELSKKDYKEIKDDEFLDKAADYIRLSKEIEELEASRTALKADLIAFSDGDNIKGGGIKIRLAEGKKTISWKAYAKDHKIKDEDLIEYTKVSEGFWTVSIEP